MSAFKKTRTALQILNLALLTVSLSAPAAEKDQPSQDIPLPGLGSTEPKPRGDLTVFTPDRKFFASLSPAGTIKYCGADGAVLLTFYQCSPRAAVFSNDGTLLCSTGQYDRGAATIMVWRVADGKLLCKFSSNTSDVPILTFSPDARLLAGTAGKSRINLWEIPDGNLKWSVSLNRGITSLGFDKSGTNVIARCGDKSSKRLATVDGELVPRSRSEGAQHCRIYDDRGVLVANELWAVIEPTSVPSGSLRKWFPGSTGDPPVPSGGPPDGTRTTVRTNNNAPSQVGSPQFRSASRRPERASRPRYRFSKHALTKFNATACKVFADFLL